MQSAEKKRKAHATNGRLVAKGATFRMSAQSTVPIPASARNTNIVQPEGISFGERVFTEPRRYPTTMGGPNFLVPTEQGLYAILTPDESCGPRPFAILFIGEARNLSQRLTRDHEKYAEWMKSAGRGLYFAYHLTIGYTYDQRREAEVELVKAYKPACNVHLDATPTLRGLTWLRTAPPARLR